MKLLLMLVIMGLTLVMIFVGSNDAARRKEDKDKYGGDALIKAISEYNEKSNSIHGYIGSVGVTRTPLTEGAGSSNNNRRTGSSQGNQMPAYMMNRPSDAQRPFNGAGGGTGFGNRQNPSSEYYPPNPYMPQTHRNNNNNQDNGGYPPAANQGQAPAGGDSGGGDNSYYPPSAPAPQEQAPMPPQSYNSNPSGKEYVVPMTLPPQAIPTERLRLPSGQQVAFAGVDVYTFDQNGKPIAMPDGIYQLGRVKLHVRDGKKVSE